MMSIRFTEPLPTLLAIVWSTLNALQRLIVLAFAFIACGASSFATGLWRATFAFLPVLVALALLSPSKDLFHIPASQITLASVIPQFDRYVPPTAEQRRRQALDDRRNCEAEKTADAEGYISAIDCDNQLDFAPAEVTLTAAKSVEAGYVLPPAAYIITVFSILALTLTLITFNQRWHYEPRSLF
jgi:hypothetical protein